MQGNGFNQAHQLQTPLQQNLMADSLETLSMNEAVSAPVLPFVHYGYYIIRFSFQRLPGIPATGIILLPMTQVANWQNFMMYQVNHYLLSSEVEGAPVSTDQHDMSSILSSFNDFEYLMFKEKVRVVVPHENIDALDKLLHRIKPLYDEHAMLFTIDARASQSVRRIENFGTWADQVLYSVQRRADVNGLFWKSLDEVNEDLTVTNIPLQFKRK